MVEYSISSVGVKCLYYLGESDTVSQGLLQIDNGGYRFVNDILDPLLCLTNMAEIFVGLKKLSLFVHPISTFPAISTRFLSTSPVYLVSSLKSAAATKADDLLGR